MSEIDVRIVEALGRMSQAYRVLLRNESQAHALSPIQAQILIFLDSQPGARCKVTALAAEFDLTKATISDSIKSLLQKCLVRKCPDPADERSYTIMLTSIGKQTALKASGFISTLQKPLGVLTDQQKEAVYTGLLQIIYGLHRSGVISVLKMCFTCRHYRQINGGHHCNLLQLSLSSELLRLDCAEHEKAV